MKFKAILSDWIKRVGRNEGSNSVYYLEGKGYWECPSHVSVYQSTSGHISIEVTYREKGKRRRKCRNVRTLDDFIKTVTRLLDYIGDHLYIAQCKGKWIHDSSKLVWVTQQDNRYAIMVTIPNALRVIRGNDSSSIMVGSVALDVNPLTSGVYDKALEKAKEFKDEFQSRWKRTPTDIMRYHTTNPSVRMVAITKPS